MKHNLVLEEKNIYDTNGNIINNGTRVLLELLMFNDNNDVCYGDGWGDSWSSDWNNKLD